MSRYRVIAPQIAALLGSAILTGLTIMAAAGPVAAATVVHTLSVSSRDVNYHSMTIFGLNIAYGEAGEVHRLKGGHFAAEDNAPSTAAPMKIFYDQTVRSGRWRHPWRFDARPGR